MPRNPVQKTIDNPRMLGGMDILYNNVIPYDVPRYTDGNLWRYIAYKQPIIQDCITAMVMYAQSLPWDVRAINAKDNKKREDDIITYKRLFNEAGGASRLNHLDFLIQDYYTVPFGGASEAVRYSDDRLYKIVNIDAATLYPTNNPMLPVMQKVGIREPILYEPDQIVRMFSTPRTEISRAGWGMSPVEKVYLAVELLNRGDKYYAQLMLDTPEAGLLDLGDMSKESAEKWLESFKSLISGIDAFKIPVLYQHTVPAKFIPFGRPPTEIAFNDVTFKYASLVTAAFGINVGDIGMKHLGGGAALSAQMRDERHAKATGYASLRAHLTEYYNNFLPEGLEFIFIDTDDELLVAKGRARSANAVGMRNLIEAGVITPEQGRDQLIADGLITIPLPDVAPKAADFDILKDISGLNDQIDIQQQQVDIQQEQVDVQKKTAETAAKAGATMAAPGQNKIGGQGGQGLNNQRNMRGGKLEQVQGKDTVPASQGGQGEIKSMAGEDSLFGYTLDKYNPVINGLTEIRSRRLIKAALKKNFSMIQTASNLDNLDEWKTEYLNTLFGMPVSDSIMKSLVEEQIETFSKFIESDNWYAIKLDQDYITKVLSEYYLSGLKWGANKIQEALYEDGQSNSLEVNTNFEITNSTILDTLKAKSVAFENFINDGTKFYLTRLSLGAIVEILPDNIELIKGSTLESILDDNKFIYHASQILAASFANVMKNPDAVQSLLQNTSEDGITEQYKRCSVAIIEDIDYHYPKIDRSKLQDVRVGLTGYYGGD